jgi:diaminopimelate epimerase
MSLLFSKYSVTGNDFIIIDDRENKFQAGREKLWKGLCERRLGVGADGVLLLCDGENVDFTMRYYNADGNEAEMCGNGARAICHFAEEIFGKKEFKFKTMNGEYNGEIHDDEEVSIQMAERSDVELYKISDLAPFALNSYFVNTGVPHCVYQVDSIKNINVEELGRKICHDALFPSGTNVNFFEVLSEGHVFLRTYERGVEAETLSCGTGATATALACDSFFKGWDLLTINVLGGELKISLDDNLEKIMLRGKVEKIYTGSISF